MSRARAVVAAPALAFLLAACGGGGQGARVSRSELPLVAGAQVVEQATQCDRGASGFCELELIVRAPGFRSSGDLVTSEHRLLGHHGWRQVSGITGEQQGADSPGGKLFATYATALADLTGVDESWLKRPRGFTLALAREVFAREPAMSVMLETGPG